MGWESSFCEKEGRQPLRLLHCYRVEFFRIRTNRTTLFQVLWLLSSGSLGGSVGIVLIRRRRDGFLHAAKRELHLAGTRCGGERLSGVESELLAAGEATE